MDDIPIELWKAAGEEGVDILWRICKLIWTKGEWPKDWRRAVCIPIPKKGNMKECSNYRTISRTCQESFAEDHQRQNQATL